MLNNEWNPDKPSPLPADPEERLWQNVLIQAFRDAKNNTNTSQMRSEKQKAKAWLTSNTPDFNFVCTLAGINPFYAARGFRQYFKKHSLNKRNNGEIPLSHHMVQAELPLFLTNMENETMTVTAKKEEVLKEGDYKHLEVSKDFLENIKLEELCDNVRDEILSWFQVPTFNHWPDMTEDQQRDFVKNIRHCAENVIVKVTKAIASEGLECFPGKVEQGGIAKPVKEIWDKEDAVEASESVDEDEEVSKELENA